MTLPRVAFDERGEVVDYELRPGGTHPGRTPNLTGVQGVKSAADSLSASRVPTSRDALGTDALPLHPLVAPEEPLLHVETAEEFAAVDEADAEPLLGADDQVVVAAGGTCETYGDGGAAKTSTGLDRACHMCAGDPWLGLPVPRPVVALWIENEGPRGMFRKKLREKLAAWDGSPIEDRLHVLTEPWSMFRLPDERHRMGLVELVDRLGVEIVFAGPVQRLGVEGGGTPEQVQAFVDLLEQVKVELGRPLAYDLIHHENKQGDVSGAWEGTTDTLIHMQKRGPGASALVWQKTRWASELQGKTWKLLWRPGLRYEIDETPELTDEFIGETLLAIVREAPGESWNHYEGLLQGQAKRKRAIRDALLAGGDLLNLGTEKTMRLWLPEQSPEQTTIDEEEA